MMRRVFALSLCACLFALAGCGTLGTSGGEQVPVKAASVAAQWDYFPDWKTLGMKLVGTPPRDVSGPVEIGLTTDKDISLVGYLTDLSSGKELPEASYPIHDGSTWRLAAQFPKAGQYTFTVFGKLKATAGNTYSALARASFTVTGDPAANWAVFPGFKAHGLSIATVPLEKVSDEAQIVLATGENLEFGWIFYNKTSGDYPSGQVRAQVSGSRVSFTVSFPDTADYELQLECRPSGSDDNAWESIAIARFTATVSAASIGAPENWKVTVGTFKKLGVAVVSAPPRAVTDQADIVLSSKVKMSLAYNLTNHTTGKDTEVMKDVVEIDQQDLEQHVTLFFPDPGDYELSLWAKAEGDKDDAVLARVSFTATPSPAPKVPDNWEVAPRFKTFGLSVLSASPRNTGEGLSVVLGVPEGWTGDAYIRNKEGTSSVDTMASAIAGKEQRISAVFPRSGEYTLSVSGKPATEKYSRTLATATFVVKMDDSLSPYRLWRTTGGSWPRVPVTQVKLVQESWMPFGEYPSFDEYRTGVLTDAVTVVGAAASVPFAKGTTLTFAHGYGNEFSVDAVSGNLARDVTIKANGTTLLFSAGSPFVVAEKQAVGQLIRDTKIVLEGNTLLAPKGSRVSYWGSDVSEVLPAGKPTLTVGAKAYEVNGTVQVDTGAQKGSPLIVKIKTARDYPLKIGTTSFTLPAGSLLSFTKQAVSDVVFVKDTKATVAGAADTLHAGEGIRFDSKGVATKYTAEEAE